MKKFFKDFWGILPLLSLLIFICLMLGLYVYLSIKQHDEGTTISQCIESLGSKGICKEGDIGFNLLAKKYLQQCTIKKFVNTRAVVPIDGLLIEARCSDGRKIEIPFKELK